LTGEALPALWIAAWRPVVPGVSGPGSNGRSSCGVAGWVRDGRESLSGTNLVQAGSDQLAQAAEVKAPMEVQEDARQPLALRRAPLLRARRRSRCGCRSGGRRIGIESRELRRVRQQWRAAMRRITSWSRT
jgi:hypothetical protein